MENKTLAVPTIHLNGTGAKRLLEEVDVALSKLEDAAEAVCQMTVHSRDYYVQDNPDVQFQKAWQQAIDRQKKIQNVIDELRTYRYLIFQQTKR